MLREYLINYILGFLEFIIMYIFMSHSFENIFKDKFILHWGQVPLIAAVGFALNYSDLPVAIEQIVIYGVVAILTIYLFKGPIKSKLFFLTIFYILTGIIDMVIFNLGALVLDGNFEQLVYTVSMERVQVSVLSKVILFTGIKWCQYFRGYILKEIPKKIWLMLALILVISICSLLGLLELSLGYNEDYRASLFLSMGSLGILAINITVYMIFQQIIIYLNNEKENEVIQYQREMLITTTMEKNEQIKDVRKVWHDFNNHISCIDMLLQMKNIDKARSYIKNMQIGSQNIYIEIDTGNDILDAVINQKYTKAKAAHIQFDVKAYIEQSLHIEDMDLCAVLSNGIDNAIEANLRIEDLESRKIEIILSIKEPYLDIYIANAVNEAYRPEETLTTIKEDKKRHGIGTRSMQQIVEKYQGEMSWKYEDRLFELFVKIKVV